METIELTNQISELTTQMATLSNSLFETEERLKVDALKQRIDDTVKSLNSYQRLKRNLGMYEEADLIECIKNQLLGKAY